ncbi:hypothetical protein QM027_05720 [Campylobacter concisus]
MIDLFQIIGFLGMICIVMGYFLLQIGRLNSHDLAYQIIKFSRCGAAHHLAFCAL